MKYEDARVEKTVESFTKKIVLQKPETSKDGDTVPPANQIVDDMGRVWALGHEKDHGGNTVLRDGFRVPGAGCVLAWSRNSVYLKNEAGAWYLWDIKLERWTPAGNPFPGN